MKSKHWTVSIIISLLLAIVVVDYFIISYQGMIIKNHKRQMQIPQTKHHIHEWQKWSEAEITSNWYYGTRLWQKRVCKICNECEMKTTTVSASGK